MCTRSCAMFARICRRIGVARGCSGCTCTPQGGENFFRRNLQGKCVSAPPRTRSAPPSQSRSQFLGQFLLGGLDLEVYLDVLWGRRLKNRQLFGKKKCTPDKILATPMCRRILYTTFRCWREGLHDRCCGLPRRALCSTHLRIFHHDTVHRLTAAFAGRIDDLASLEVQWWGREGGKTKVWEAAVLRRGPPADRRSGG